MSYNLKIGIDTKAVKSSIDELVRTVGSKPITFNYDKNTKALLEGHFRKELEYTARSIQKTQQQLAQTARMPANEARSKQIEYLTQDLVAGRQAVSNQTRQMQELGLGGSAGGGFGSRLMRAGGYLAAGAGATMATGSVGAAMGGLGGAVGSLFGKGPLGAAVGAGLGGAVDLFGGRYMDASSSFARWQGQGYSRTDALKNSSRSYGYNFERTAPLVDSIMQNRGFMDRGSWHSRDRGGTKLLESMQRFGTGFGVENSAMQGVLGAVRSTGAAGNDYQKKTAEIFASALSARLERGQIGQYLEQTASTISEFASKTFGVNSGQVSNMMSTMMARGIAGTPGQAASQLQGLDSMIRNPSQSIGGAFIMNAMGKTLMEGGFKGPLPLGVQAWKQTGLFAPDMKNVDSPVLRNLFGAMNPAGFAKNLTSDINRSVKGLGPQGEIVQALLMSQAGFPGGINSASKFIGKAMSPDGLSTQDVGTLLENLDQQTEASLSDLKKNLDIIIAQDKAYYDWAIKTSGGDAAKVMGGVQRKTGGFIESIGDIFGDVMSKTPGARRARGEYAQNKFGFKTQAERDQFAALANVNPDLYGALMKDPIPSQITDLFRTSEENANTPGAARNSAHQYGRAADLHSKSLSPAEKAAKIAHFQSLGFSAGIHSGGTSNEHIHVEGGSASAGGARRSTAWSGMQIQFHEMASHGALMPHNVTAVQSRRTQ